MKKNLVELQWVDYQRQFQKVSINSDVIDGIGEEEILNGGVESDANDTESDVEMRNLEIEISGKSISHTNSTSIIFDFIMFILNRKKEWKKETTKGNSNPQINQQIHQRSKTIETTTCLTK